MRSLKPQGGLTNVFGTATARSGGYGTDSLDLLFAAAAASSGARILRRLGVDPSGVQRAADHVRANRQPEPGLTDDAKRVAEALARHALEGQRNPNTLDLLISLASVDSPAQEVLMAAGVDEARLRAVM